MQLPSCQRPSKFRDCCHFRAIAARVHVLGLATDRRFRMVLRANNAVLAALILLAFGIAISHSKITGWQLVSAPSGITPEAVFTFEVMALGADLLVFADATNDTRAPTLSFELLINNVTVWTTTFDQEEDINTTLTDALPPQVPITIEAFWYDSGVLVNTAVRTLDAIATSDYWIFSSQSETIGATLFSLDPFLRCCFTSLPYQFWAPANLRGLTNTFDCSLSDNSDYANQNPAGTPFVVSINYTVPVLSGNPLVIPGPYVTINSSAIVDATSSNNFGIDAACVKTISVNVTGQFFPDRFYACNLTLGNNATLTSAFTSPARGGTSVVCRFNTSDIIYMPAQGGRFLQNIYALTSLSESLSVAGTSPAYVQGNYYEASWSILPCDKHSTPFTQTAVFWVIVIGGSVALSAGVAAVFFGLRRSPDPASQPLIRNV